MKIQVKATGIELTPAIEEYVNKKVEMLEKFLPTEEDPVLYVEIGRMTEHHKSGEVYKAEITLHVFGRDFRAVSEKEDLFAAIDEMKDEVMNSLRSNKDKRVTLLRRGGQKVKDMIRGFYWKK